VFENNRSDYYEHALNAPGRDSERLDLTWESLCLHAAEWRLSENVLFLTSRSCVYLHSKQESSDNEYVNFGG